MNHELDTIVIEGGPGQKVVTKDSAYVTPEGVVRFINGGPGDVHVYFPVGIITPEGEPLGLMVAAWEKEDVAARADRGEYAFYVYEDFGIGRLDERRTRSAELLHSQPRIVIVASSTKS